MNNSRVPLGLRIGIDLTEIDRFRGLKPEAPFIKRVFSESEIAYCFGNKNPAPCLATNFAGKEAVYKALRLDEPLPLESIEILRRESGTPYVRLPDSREFEVGISLSRTSKYAAAIAMVLDDENINFVSTEKLLNDALQDILPDE
jgi:holo-[acyl-carrier protein] synthase